MVASRCARALAVALLLGCGLPPPDPVPDRGDLARLLPPPSSLAGWSVAEGPSEYAPDTLWEYLDGGAPRYLTFGFRRLVHVRFERAGDPPGGITLDVFDMGGELGAFGIYSNVRTPEAAPRDWGVDGHRAGAVAAAWKGHVYVHAAADEERPDLIDGLERLVAEVCDRIPGEASRPEILGRLPHEGLVPSSERYVAENLLGHAFLPGGVLATYEVEGHRVELFFSDLGSEAAATGAMAALRAHQSGWGRIASEVPSIGAGGFRFSDPGLGSGIATRVGAYVAGVHGDAPGGTQERLLGRLVERLAPPGPGAPSPDPS